MLDLVLLELKLIKTERFNYHIKLVSLYGVTVLKFGTIQQSISGDVEFPRGLILVTTVLR